jgi:hypothetical protein
VILGKNLNTAGTQPRFIADKARDIAAEALAALNLEEALEAVEDAQGHAQTALGYSKCGGELGTGCRNQDAC